jgi:hypothetical protein
MKRHLTQVSILLLGLSAVTTAQTPGLYDQTTFRNLNLTFAASNWYDQLRANKASETYIKADLVVENVTIPDVGVRARGFSAYMNGQRTGKLPLKISFDEFVPGRKFMGVEALDLNNGFWTPTWMREVLILDIMREFVPTPRCNFVNVVINNQNYGVYLSVEVPNKEFLEQHYRDENGNRHKGTTTLLYRGLNVSDYSSRYPLVSPPQPNSYQDLIAALLTTTYTGAQAAAEIPKLCNVEGAMKIMALNVAVNNTDSYPRHNYYIYMDPYHGLMEIIPWDVNLALRNATIAAAPTFFTQVPLWTQWWKGHLRDVAENYLDWNQLGPKVATLQALIDAAVQADPVKLYTYNDFKNGINGTVANLKGVRPAIEDLRKAILAAHTGPRVLLSAPRHTPVDPKPDDTVWINVTAALTGSSIKNVNLHWRSVGHYRMAPMFDDGNHRDGAANDGVFGVALPFTATGIEVSYYFSAEAQNSNISFLPMATDHRPYQFRFRKPTLGSVVIHELMARNTKGIRDENGQLEDWIEIYNPTSAPVDLSGMFLSDNPGNVSKWQFPDRTTLAAGGTLIVWADEDGSQGPLHCSFRLAESGEEVYLSDRDKTLLDFAAFGAQQADVSFGRLFDQAISPWVTSRTPTPNGKNQLAAPCGVRSFSAADPFSHWLTADLVGAPKLDATVMLRLAGAAADAPFVVLLGLGVEASPLPFGLTLLVNPLAVAFVVPGSPTGAVGVPLAIPNDPSLDGGTAVVQALAADPVRVASSNAVQLRFCK